MYLEHYGLRAKPFSKSPDPAFLFPSRQHAEALARLCHALEEREPAVLTGEVGAGKTTLSRALVDEFADRCRFALVVNPALPAAQLLAAISDAFGLPRQKRKGDVYAALAEFAAALDAQDQFPVVVVDEAQLLPGRGAYDELRLLTNLTADDRSLIGLVLVGQPERRDRIRSKGGEAFSQRIGVAYHLGALDLAEVGSYLSHRLQVAGRQEPLFSEDAVAELHARSGGVPRRINQLAASALLEGFARDLRWLDAAVVAAAAADLEAYMGGRPARG